MLPANTPTNVTYVKLPDFLTMRGTVGKPDTKINTKILASALLKGAANIPGLGDKTSGILQGLGGMLGGGSGTNTPDGTTNPPGGGVRGLLEGLGGAGAAQTNATPKSGTNAPATNQSPVNSLLDQLLKPRK
jgi:hypothetical protein